MFGLQTSKTPGYVAMTQLQISQLVQWCRAYTCCWEGVQHPDGLVDESVSQSAGSGLEAWRSPPGGQEAEEAVGGMDVVTCSAECFAGQACAVNVLEGGEGRGGGHRWSSQLLLLCAAGSSGRIQCSCSTTQWCSWSGCSRWFTCDHLCTSLWFVEKLTANILSWWLGHSAVVHLLPPFSAWFPAL